MEGIILNIRLVAFDCDGVLVDSVSSWRSLHDHFGTDNQVNYLAYLNGEITDQQFMQSDIELWKSVQAEIHRDDIFRAYQGIKLMKGARELISTLKAQGIFIAIVSAGVDVFVGAIATMLKADDWIANGLSFSDEGWLLDDGIVRVVGSKKGGVITRLMAMHEIEGCDVISVGNSLPDLSMKVEGSQFIAFNPNQDRCIEGFSSAGVPIIYDKDLRLLWPHIFKGETFPTSE
ncbi:MAG TPA: hypothetical protein EYQ53_03065 [Candidatus Poseidoniales archaeon]|nr:MAG: hypothetical protein CXT69_00535 [Euryarchaeota archaeon]HIG03348.1 hypothetical protein [Candidatus Poseidoniales archaeon]HIK78538.1 hypothetical protein [Candidatus Poseidoniales archaeon]